MESLVPVAAPSTILPATMPSQFPLSTISNSSTPDRAPSLARLHPGVRRVHTLPAKLGGQGANAASLPDAVETLFSHSEAKVVSFSAGSARPGSSSGRRPSVDVSASGELPWIVPSERTLAAGQLRLYRVPSSGVSFLNSGPLLCPILQRSQCWLVDEQSKFVLRVREGFYRIELPYVTDEDKSAVQEFKKVLSTVSHYEKTPSPFRRGYSGEPESPPRPRTPKPSEKPKERAKKWRLNKVWEPEDPEHRARISPIRKEDEDPASVRQHLRSKIEMQEENSTSTRSQESTEDEGTATDDSVSEQGIEMHSNEAGEPKLVEDGASPSTTRTFRLPLRTRPVQLRSVTVPANHPIHINSMSLIESLSESRKQDADVASLASQDSFYSADEPVIVTGTADPITQPLLDEQQLSTIKRLTHQRHISEATITPDMPSPMSARSVLSEDSREPSDPATPTLISDSDEENDGSFIDAATPPDTLRLRRLPQRRLSVTGLHQQNLQPLPPANRFFATQAPSRKKALSAALVQKAYSLLFVPPSHLVKLMLDIAAKIVRSLYREGTETMHIPGGWQSENDDEEDEWGEDAIDDYGIPLDAMGVHRGSMRSETRSSNLSRSVSRTSSAASSDYDALVEGPTRFGDGRRQSLD